MERPLDRDLDCRPITTINAGVGRTCEYGYDGKLVAVGANRGAMLFRADGTSLGLFEPQELTDSESPQITFANEGTLLIAVDASNGHKVLQYDSTSLLSNEKLPPSP